MKPQQKAAPAGTGAAEKSTSDTCHSTPNLHRQTRLVLDLLRAGPLSTCDLIEAGILRPGARVYDLRCSGFNVATERRSEYDDRGRLHRSVARYHLSVECAA